MNAPSPLILASTSPYRRQLLERLGLPFQQQAPRLDEEAAKRLLDPGQPEAMAVHLALAKARSLDAPPDAVVIGSDQIAEFEGTILGKPGTPERAVEQLARLAGRTHRLLTAVAVLANDRIELHLDVARLTMRPLDRAAIERYVEQEPAIDAVGAYKLEERGITLFEHIACDDHTAIVGLPLIALTSILARLGFTVP